MSLFETFLQDLRFGARTLRRDLGFSAVSVLALALGIGVNTVVFTAYKAFVARPLDARDPDTLVNISLHLQSGATTARFSYPDYEAYRDGLRSFSGVIAFSIEELRLTDAGGIVTRRSEESLIGRLGLASPSASNAEMASTFVVSENYFSVLGVAPVRGRAFDAFNTSELATSPSVLISENYWRRRFAGDPAVLGKSIRLNGAAFTIVGVTPANFTGTSIAVPNFWLPLSLYPVVHPDSSRLRDREELCCRVFGRLAPGVSMREAQAEMTLLASRLRALHTPDSDFRKDVNAVISAGSALPGINAGLRLTIILIMAAAGMVLVIACANASGLQLARATARQHELGMRLSLGATRSRLIRQLVTESGLLGVLAGSLALPLTWALLHLAVTKAAEELPSEFTLVLDVNPDFTVLAYVLVMSVLAGVLFGLVPALASSRSGSFSTTRGTGTSLVRSRLRQGLITAQVAVSLTLLIASGLLVRSASQALEMDTGYDAERVISLNLQFPEELIHGSDHTAAIVHDLRSRLAALPGVTRITTARAPNDIGARRAAVSVNGDRPSVYDMHAMLYYTWVRAQLFRDAWHPPVPGAGLSGAVRTTGARRDSQCLRRAAPLARTEPDRFQPAPRNRRTIPQQGRAATRRPELVGHRRGPRHTRRDDGRQRRTTGLPSATEGPTPGLPDPRSDTHRSDVGDARHRAGDHRGRSGTGCHGLDAAGDASSHGCVSHRQHVSGDRVQHQPLRAPAGLDGDLQHRQLRRRPSHARNRHPDGHRRSEASRPRFDDAGQPSSRGGGIASRDCAGRRSVASAARRALRPWRHRCRVLRWRVLAVPDHRAGRDVAAFTARGARRSTCRAQGSVIRPPASHHVVRVAGFPR